MFVGDQCRIFPNHHYFFTDPPPNVEKSASCGSVAPTSSKPVNFPKNSKNVHQDKKSDKDKTKDKQKTDSNVGGGGNEKTPPTDPPKKTKKFGDDYVEAPLPVNNPWKKASNPTVGFQGENDPTPAAASTPVVTRAKEVKPVAQAPAAGEYIILLLSFTV